jgi:hypothetical protein
MAPAVVLDLPYRFLPRKKRSEVKKHRFFLILATVLAAASPAIASGADLGRHHTTPLTNTTGSDGVQMAYLPLVIVSRLERARERLNIFYSGSQDFPAETPFHIAHGWTTDATEEHLELFDFQLQVDSAYRKEDFVEMRPGEHITYVFNFPEGMTGIHVFTGHWFAPCRAVDEDCTNPDQVIETGTSNVEVTFTP